jgi:uncharacterized lipoprotein YehR (DUF1307 family)
MDREKGGEQSTVIGIKMKKTKKIVLILAIMFFLFGCQSEDSRTVPRKLRGVWGTSAPKYKKCFLELTEDQIIFTNEDVLDKMSFNSIESIEKREVGKQVLYTITYKDDDDQEYELAFFYDPKKGGTIRFFNQRQIRWKKAAF